MFLEKFRSYLLGIEIIIFSNHPPLLELKFMIIKKESRPRLKRSPSLLENFHSEKSKI